MEMTDLAVHKSVTVDVTAERAFEAFTHRIDDWWIRAHHIGKAEMDRAVLEGRAGGRWYEIGVDGTECDWGHVVVWEPPTRLVLAWQIGADWQFDPDLVTEVEVRFVDLGDNRTRVDLEHRDLDRFGDRADDMRAGFDSPGGWQGLLDAFKSAV
jgi:uncharacterized protein YndB with AHSA1/START domain